MRRLAALFATALGATATAAPTLAMNGHLPSEGDCAAMETLGARAVRMDFNWFQFNPTQGNFDWAIFDSAVQSANNHHLGVYATVAYTPQWASSAAGCTQSSADANATCNNKLPANTADWTNAITETVTRYKRKVECWGIWNEPNLGTFFAGSEDQFVNQIFIPAATAIRAADPAAKICGPELSGLTASSSWNGKKGQCIGSSCIRNGWELDLGDLLDKVGNQIDIVTQHTYQSDATGVVTFLLDGSSVAGVLTHDSVRDVLTKHGAANKEFWLTESGWEHTPQGSLAPADVATRAVDLFNKQEQVCAGTYSGSTNVPWKNWARTYYYHFPFDPNSGWGIVGMNDSPLPAYTQLQAWASGRTTSACGPAAVIPDMGSSSDLSVTTPADAAVVAAADLSTSAQPTDMQTGWNALEMLSLPEGVDTAPGCGCRVARATPRDGHLPWMILVALLAVAAVRRRRARP